METVTALTATAYHEAGHAVCMIELNRRIKNITINNVGKELGSVEYSLCRNYRHRSVIEQEIMICLAGPIAEQRFNKNCDRNKSMADFSVAFSHAGRVCRYDDESEKYIDWLGVRTENLLDSRWIAVEAIAAKLIKDKSIKGRDAHSIFKKHCLRQLS